MSNVLFINFINIYFFIIMGIILSNGECKCIELMAWKRAVNYIWLWDNVSFFDMKDLLFTYGDTPFILNFESKKYKDI